MNFAGIVQNIQNIVNQDVLPLLVVLAFVFFLINIVRYFFIESGEEANEKGRQALLFGLIGLAVLFSVWGLINLFVNTLNGAVGVAGS